MGEKGEDLCSLCCLQWNKSKYRDHKYQHLVWSTSQRCTFIRKVRKYETAPPFDSIDRPNARFAFLLVYDGANGICYAIVRLRLRWCTHIGWARMMFVFYLCDGCKSIPFMLIPNSLSLLTSNVLLHKAFTICIVNPQSLPVDCVVSRSLRFDHSAKDIQSNHHNEDNFESNIKQIDIIRDCDWETVRIHGWECSITLNSWLLSVDIRLFEKCAFWSTYLKCDTFKS